MKHACGSIITEGTNKHHSIYCFNHTGWFIIIIFSPTSLKLHAHSMQESDFLFVQSTNGKGEEEKKKKLVLDRWRRAGWGLAGNLFLFGPSTVWRDDEDERKKLQTDGGSADEEMRKRTNKTERWFGGCGGREVRGIIHCWENLGTWPARVKGEEGEKLLALLFSLSGCCHSAGFVKERDEQGRGGGQGKGEVGRKKRGGRAKEGKKSCEMNA